MLSVIVALLAIFVGGAAPRAAARVHPPRSLRLCILDCGTIAPMDPALFGLKPGEFKGDVSFVTACYLVVHPKGTLIRDVGQADHA